MAGKLLIDVQWSVAVLAPWAIAPHPNFSVSSAGQCEILALVAAHRFRDLRQYSEKARTAASWEIDLVSAASSSVIVREQEEGVARLAEMAVDPALPLGARAAAVLMSSVGYSELDRPEAALALLSRVLDDAQDLPESASRFLIEAALWQQTATRSTEAGDRQYASVASSLALRSVASMKGRSYERFSTSKGISWASQQVQRDVARTLEGHALELVSRLETLAGDTWQQVVKRRPDWVDVRAERKANASLELLLQESFEHKLVNVHPARKFGGNRVEDDMAAALYNAEVCGDFGEIVRRREALGKIRLLQPAESKDFSYADSIRLLRQADSRGALESAMRWLQAEGPSAVIGVAARRVLARPSLRDRVYRADLTVLSNAAELLSAEEKRVAIMAARRYLESSDRMPPGVTLGWEDRSEPTWRAMSRLLPGSGEEIPMAQYIAERILNGDIGDLQSYAFEAVVDACVWHSLPADLHRDLLAWASEHDKSGSRQVAFALSDAIGGVAGTRQNLQRPEGLQLAARLLYEKSLGLEPLQDELIKAQAASIRAMESDQVEAQAGSFSFGGFSSVDVALALAIEFDLPLWSLVAEYLSNERLNPAQKTSALERVALLKGPDKVNMRASMMSDWSAWSSGQLPFFVSPPASFSVAPASVRAAGNLGLIEESEAVEIIASFAGSGESVGRREAARSIPYVTPRQAPWDWCGVLLLQLSRDIDPIVRADTAFSIACIDWGSSSLKVVLTQRLLELLRDDGLRVPNAVLRGLAELPSGSTLGNDVAEALRKMASEHPAEFLKQRADNLLVEGSRFP